MGRKVLFRLYGKQALYGLESRLAGTGQVDEPLLAQGRAGLGIAARVVRFRVEVPERPHDRPVHEGLAGQYIQVVGEEVLLERIGALLRNRARAVRLGTELRHEQRLARIVAVEPLEVGAERVASGERALRTRVPPEVVVHAERVELRVERLPADGRIALDREPDEPGRVELRTRARARVT